MVMEKYDYNSGKWSSMDLSSLNINKCESYYYYSMASGEDEIYFLYWNNEGSFNLATYSEVTNSFISDVCLDYVHFGIFSEQQGSRLRVLKKLVYPYGVIYEAY